MLDIFGARPDIVHLHNLHGGYFDLRYLPYLSRAVPTLVTLHDAWLFSGHCAHSLGCERWRTGCGRCPDLSLDPAVQGDATAYNWRRKRDILARCRLYVASPTNQLLRQFEESIATPAAIETRLVRHGIDTRVFRPGHKSAARRALGIEPDVSVLLFAARGIRQSVWKDYGTMRDSVARVAQRMGGKVLFLALGEDGAEEELGAARVRFVPFAQDPQRVALHYQAADAYLHAARPEVWGLTIIEAMACVCPVVATQVGGIPEQVEHEHNGLLVPVGDAHAMAHAIGRLLSDPDTRRHLADAAANTAVRRFSLDVQVEEYLAWYRQIVEAQSERRLPAKAA